MASQTVLFLVSFVQQNAVTICDRALLIGGWALSLVHSHGQHVLSVAVSALVSPPRRKLPVSPKPPSPGEPENPHSPRRSRKNPSPAPTSVTFCTHVPQQWCWGLMTPSVPSPSTPDTFCGKRGWEATMLFSPLPLCLFARPFPVWPFSQTMHHVPLTLCKSSNQVDTYRLSTSSLY